MSEFNFNETIDELGKVYEDTKDLAHGMLPLTPSEQEEHAKILRGLQRMRDLGASAAQAAENFQNLIIALSKQGQAEKTFDDFIPAIGIPRNLASFIGWNSHRQDFLVKSLYEAVERYAAYLVNRANETKYIAIEALRVQSQDVKQYEAYSKELELFLTEDQCKEAYTLTLKRVPDLPLSEIPSFEQQAKHAGFIEGAKAQKPVCAEHAKVWEDHFRGRVNYYVDKDSIINSPDAASPYEPREKGREDE